MASREEFEEWMAGFLDISKVHLEACRWVDSDGMIGYDGLDKWYSQEADDLVSTGLQSWLARGGELGLGEPPLPQNCREHLRLSGMPYPKSGCYSCGNGGITGCPHKR